MSIRLTEYSDYRLYLQDIMSEECKLRKGMSVAKFAVSFGMSRSALSMILSGSRSLSLSQIHKVAAALRLDRSDHAYFEALVLKCQAKNRNEETYYESKLELERVQRNTHAVTSASRTLVSEWFVPALLVYFIDVPNAMDHVDVMASKLGVTEQHIRDVVAELEKEGFLNFRGKGTVHISFNRVVAAISSQRYMKMAMTEALRRVETSFECPRHFFGVHSFSIGESDLAHLVEEYKALVTKYLSTSPALSKDESVVIVQISTQLLPVF